MRGPSNIAEGGLSSKDPSAMFNCSVICERGLSERTLKYREGRPLVEGPLERWSIFQSFAREASVRGTSNNAKGGLSSKEPSAMVNCLVIGD